MPTSTRRSRASSRRCVAAALDGQSPPWAGFGPFGRFGLGDEQGTAERHRVALFIGHAIAPNTAVQNGGKLEFVAFGHIVTNELEHDRPIVRHFGIEIVQAEPGRAAFAILPGRAIGAIPAHHRAQGLNRSIR